MNYQRQTFNNLELFGICHQTVKHYINGKNRARKGSFLTFNGRRHICFLTSLLSKLPKTSSGWGNLGARLVADITIDGAAMVDGDLIPVVSAVHVKTLAV